MVLLSPTSLKVERIRTSVFWRRKEEAGTCTDLGRRRRESFPFSNESFDCGGGAGIELRKGAIPKLRWATLFSCYTAKQLYTHPSNTILKWQVWHSTWTWRCNNSGMKPGNATWQNSLHPRQHFFLTVCTKMKNQQTELTPADASSWKNVQVHKVS